MSRINIDPDGDILLLIPSPSSLDVPAAASNLETNGGSTEPKAENKSADDTWEVLVSSKILSIVSLVFKAMLYGGKFSESVALSAAKNTPDQLPYRLRLPGDDAEAMTLLCKLVHFDFGNIVDRPCSTALEGLAVVCDKYECAAALKYPGAIWIQSWLAHYRTNTPDVDDICRLLVFTYVLDLGPEFVEVAWMLLLHHKGPLTGQHTQAAVLVDHPLLHQDVRAYLDMKRLRLCNEFHEGVMAPLTWNWVSLTKPCFRGARAIAVYTEALRNQKLFPYDLEFSKLQFLELLDLAKRAQSIKVPACSSASLHVTCHCCSDPRGGLWKPMQTAAELICSQKAWYGCLDCLRGGRTMDDGEKDCRAKHGPGPMKED